MHKALAKRIVSDARKLRKEVDAKEKRIKELEHQKALKAYNEGMRKMKKC